MAIQDADLEYDPTELPVLIRPIVDGVADVVYGSRYRGANWSESPRKFRLANRLLTTLSNLTTGLSLTDMETGHKVFRRHILQHIPLRENRFGIEPELTAKFARAGLGIVEIPISYAPRDWQAGKKIGFRDGVSAVWCILRYRFRD